MVRGIARRVGDQKLLGHPPQSSQLFIPLLKRTTPSPGNTLPAERRVVSDVFDTLIVSDVHLGTGVSRADALLATLKRSTFNRLILLGDIFDDLNFAKLHPSHWSLLSHVQKLAAPRSGIEVVWVEGNHDRLLSKVIQTFLGIPIYKQYEWVHRGKKLLALHGHQFDTFITRYPYITGPADQLYRTIQRIEPRHYRLSRLLKHSSKTWLRISEQIAWGALSYAKKRDATQIFCGHTHYPMSQQSAGVTYYNTGCWTETPATFITVSDYVALRECA